MKRTSIFLGLALIAIVLLVVVIWQVKTISGSASLKGKETGLMEGRLVFKSQCARCHGDTGQGFGERPDIRQSGLSEIKIREIIQNGLDEMPSFPNISEPALNQLVAYVNSL